MEQEQKHGRVDPESLIENTSDKNLEDTISRIIFEKDPFSDKAELVVNDLVRRVMQGEIESRLASLRMEIEDAQTKGDEGKWRALLEEQQELLARRSRESLTEGA